MTRVKDELVRQRQTFQDTTYIPRDFPHPSKTSTGLRYIGKKDIVYPIAPYLISSPKLLSPSQNQNFRLGRRTSCRCKSSALTCPPSESPEAWNPSTSC